MTSAPQQPPFFEDYEVTEQVDHGGTSVVYCVSCRRGRLKGRKLALKEISTSVTESPSTLTSSTRLASAALHQALHHPNIVALYSVFSTTAVQYHALEFCPGGNLYDFLSSRDPPTLPESDIRRLLKGMANALLYLGREEIVHRNINPSNILLTGNGEPKLSDFKFATPIHSPDAVLSEICGLEEYAAPEMRTHSRYGFPVDAWSLGCVVNASFFGPQRLKNCSPGVRPEELCCGSPNTSVELKNLVAGLLEKCQKTRLRPPQILSHPFILIQAPIGKFLAMRESNCQQVKIPALQRRRSLQHMLVEKRSAPVDLDLGNIPSNGITSRRVVSDPFPSSAVLFLRDYRQKHQPSHRKRSMSAAKKLQVNPFISQRDTLRETPEPNCEVKCVPLHAAGSQPGLPVGTTRPSPFNTSLLNPKTHKFANGQIIILPSRSLLIDFRENERRRGMKGDEVLLVEPTGIMIKVYKAPHLSVPCCLVEPTAGYTVYNLPSIYWKQYNDAGRHLQQVKQRTPKLTLYTTNSKCTMMANGPIPDIELLFEPGVLASKTESDLSDKDPEVSSLRIRLSRQHRSLEFAQHVTGDRGPEWTKQLIPSLELHPFMSESSWVNLEEAKKEGIQQLSHFLGLCEMLEAATNNWTVRTATVDISAGVCVDKFGESRKEQNGTRLATNISSFHIPPRPPKLSTGIRMNAWSPQGNASNKAQNWMASLDAHQRSDLEPTSEANAASKDPKPQVAKTTGQLEARFIPSIGWCTRYGPPGRSPQDDKYKIMFFDGSILDIDLDKGWVELVDGCGKTVRCFMDAASSEPTLEEPMKHFQHFLMLFEAAAR